MTISSELLKWMREYYRIAIYEGGKRRFARNMQQHMPGICIEDSNIRLHMATRAVLYQIAQWRPQWMQDLRLDYEEIVKTLPELNEYTINPQTRCQERPVLWFDVFLWFIRPIDRRFQEGATVYVSAWDRETPPAKHLKHLERYHKKPVKENVRIRGPDHVREIFQSPYVPLEFDSYLHQKSFVDAFARHLTQQFICVYYTPPPSHSHPSFSTTDIQSGDAVRSVCESSGQVSKNDNATAPTNGDGKGEKEKMLIVDGHTQHQAMLIKSGAREFLENPAYSCHCAEADLSVVFWSNVFRAHDVEVMSRDGDILFSLLMQSRYRVMSAAPSPNNPALREFSFRNTVYLSKDHRSFEENESEHMDRAYMDLCRQESPNEVSVRHKDAFLARLEERQKMQQQEMDFLDSPCETTVMKEVVPAPTNEPANVSESKKRKRPSKIAKTLNGEESPSNADMRAGCDIVYTPEGCCRFERYEIFNVNVLFQAIYDHALSIYDARMASAPSSSAFLPVESFCAVAALCGTDYVEKPRAIGAGFIVETYFKQMNALGNLVYAVSVDTRKHANYAAPPSFTSTSANSEDAKQKMSGAEITQQTMEEPQIIVPYDAYLRLTIDPNAIFLLLRNAFAAKNAKIPPDVLEELQTTIANCRFHICYFANDYKKSTPITDCFDRDAVCQRSIYGFELIDPQQPPSPFNVRRTTNICDCHVQEIRSFTAAQSKNRINLF